MTPGDRVELTELGRRRRARARCQPRGRFVAWTNDGLLLRVVFDGLARETVIPPCWVRRAGEPAVGSREWLERRAMAAAFARE